MTYWPTEDEEALAVAHLLAMLLEEDRRMTRGLGDEVRRRDLYNTHSHAALDLTRPRRPEAMALAMEWVAALGFDGAEDKAKSIPGPRGIEMRGCVISLLQWGITAKRRARAMPGPD